MVAKRRAKHIVGALIVGRVRVVDRPHPVHTGVHQLSHEPRVVNARGGSCKYTAFIRRGVWAVLPQDAIRPFGSPPNDRVRCVNARARTGKTKPLHHNNVARLVVCHPFQRIAEQRGIWQRLPGSATSQSSPLWRFNEGDRLATPWRNRRIRCRSCRGNSSFA